MKMQKFIICTEKLMEIMLLESKKQEIMTGNSILRNINLGMQKRKF